MVVVVFGAGAAILTVVSVRTHIHIALGALLELFLTFALVLLINCIVVGGYVSKF